MSGYGVLAEVYEWLISDEKLTPADFARPTPARQWFVAPVSWLRNSVHRCERFGQPGTS
ncbi:hypothetical protein [Ornithinimicrobium cerasi]|uniref:hypothetical protein n=1 Tax=Ornithinimicrobium cerasi TaxID=2248773 RepID=UPI00192A3B5E|nr:hypothetical protein [Ornithinimicrobium cerasi]